MDTTLNDVLDFLDVCSVSDRTEILKEFDDSEITDEADWRGILGPEPWIEDDEEEPLVPVENLNLIETYIRMGNRKEAIHLLVQNIPELKYHEEFLLG